MFDFRDTLGHIFNPVFSSKAAEELQETPAAIEGALNDVIPVLLTGLLYRCSATGGVQSLTGIARDASQMEPPNVSAGLLPSLTGKGAHIIQLFFEDKLPEVISSISRHSDIQPASAEALMRAVSPIVMAITGRRAGGLELTARSVLNFLNFQQESILATVPAGLGLSAILGINNLGDIGRALAQAAHNTLLPREDHDKGVSRWFWALVLLAVVLVVWFVVRRMFTP